MSEDVDRRELLQGAAGMTLVSATSTHAQAQTGRVVSYAFDKIEEFPGDR